MSSKHLNFLQILLNFFPSFSLNMIIFTEVMNDHPVKIFIDLEDPRSKMKVKVDKIQILIMIYKFWCYRYINLGTACIIKKKWLYKCQWVLKVLSQRSDKLLNLLQPHLNFLPSSLTYLHGSSGNNKVLGQRVCFSHLFFVLSWPF